MHNLAETIFNEFSELGQFLAQNLGFYDENPGFSGFFRIVTNFEQLTEIHHVLTRKWKIFEE